LNSLVVAIDGPAGAGKSTVAKRVAEATGLPFVDTGAIYRTLALASREAGIHEDDEDRLAVLAAELPIVFLMHKGVNRVRLAEHDVTDAIRRPDMSLLSSRVSRHPAVREALLHLQRELAREGAVLEGRDIGTVIFPHAPVKVFLTAGPEERARRRAEQIAQKGEAQPYDGVLKDIIARDKQDEERPVAPLKPAPDAEILDTTSLTESEVVAHITALVDAARGEVRA
jgi:CMP/dCMP kinase